MTQTMVTQDKDIFVDLASPSPLRTISLLLIEGQMQTLVTFSGSCRTGLLVERTCLTDDWVKMGSASHPYFGGSASHPYFGGKTSTNNCNRLISRMLLAIWVLSIRCLPVFKLYTLICASVTCSKAFSIRLIPVSCIYRLTRSRK
jgi:hypothetical protein